MDWTKAKTILIIAFIITNAFLFYNLERGNGFSENIPAVSDNRADDVEEILESRGIFLDGKIPMDAPQVASLEVGYASVDAEAAAKIFLGEYTFSDDVYVNGNEKLMVMDGKRLIYENGDIQKGAEPGDESAKDLAEEFLAEKGYDQDDAILQSIERENGFIEMTYVQSNDGMPLENGSMKIRLSGSGVAGFDRIWMEVLSEGETARKVIPAARALLMAMESLEESGGNEIGKIVLTYLFDTKKTSLSKWQDIKSGTALPVWRIDLSNEGGSIYVDAYEGIVISN